VIPRICVEEAEGFAPCGGVHNLVYSWQRE
jgi:hypothetical protein